jgi:hypothetical protein
VVAVAALVLDYVESVAAAMVVLIVVPMLGQAAWERVKRSNTAQSGASELFAGAASAAKSRHRADGESRSAVRHHRRCWDAGR